MRQGGEDGLHYTDVKMIYLSLSHRHGYRMSSMTRGKKRGDIMERRWTARARINLPVEMNHAGTHTEGCYTHDVGLGGVCLKVPPHVKVFNESHVELTFRVGEGSQITKHRIKARVVWVSDEEAGLMFRDFDASAFRSLQEILRFREGAAVM